MKSACCDRWEEIDEVDKTVQERKWSEMFVEDDFNIILLKMMLVNIRHTRSRDAAVDGC